MKRNTKQLNVTLNGKRMAGGMLLEVVLAIAIFAFGMLALVQLQGNLTRSNADANTRTVATNIAEEIVENIRGFQRVQVVADNDEWEYLELVGTSLNTTVTRGGMEYTVTAAIEDFWRDDVNDTFIPKEATDPPVAPAGATGGPAFASFKLLKIDVSWNTSQEFYVDDETTGDLGLREITLYEIIPSSPPMLGAKIAADPNAAGGAPLVEYTPGEAPDVAALRLDGRKLKESTTPIPDIIRSGELTETYFEVVSYNDANVFERREEFLTVGCECILNPNNGGSNFGFRPTVWNGVEYTEGDRVTDKNIGVSANNQQSDFCDVCCRDHHDGGNGINDESAPDTDPYTFEVERQVYNPWAASIDATQDHDHYSRSKKGVIGVAGDRDTYLEACRLIRRDGFWRVAQDFNQQGFFGIVEEYMNNVAEVEEYSSYVTTAIEDFYKNGQGTLPQPGDGGMPPFTNPVDGAEYDYLPSTKHPDTPSLSGPATRLPTDFDLDNQQLRSRGIYLDYMNDEVEEKISQCIADAGSCQIRHFTTALEVYPFFEVQLTKLSNWTEEPLNLPVDVTNEAIASNNSHSRGRADLKQSGMGKSKSDHGIHKGNVGIAGTDPIREDDPQAADMDTDLVYVDTDDDGTPYLFGFEITGEILSGIGGVRATDVELSFKEAQCGRTPTGYKCIIPELAVSPTLTVSNYFKNNRTLYACSDAMAVVLNGHVHGDNPSTTFDVSGSIISPADIVIGDSPCVAP